MNGSTSLSVEYRQVFLSAIDASTADTPILGVAGSLDGGIGRCLVYIGALAVLGAWSSLAHHLCLAVTIEVIDHKLGVVGTGTDVLSQVDAP